MANQYQTVEDAQQAAAEQASASKSLHAFVYHRGAVFGILWHPEDKYIFSYLPSGAAVVSHAAPAYGETLVWEPRGTLAAADRTGDPQTDSLMDIFLGYLENDDE